jgi:purine-binding chemotaxis protein CheW
MFVQEVRRYTEIAPVPGAGHDVLGIVNLRGSVVTVVDARVRLSHEDAPITDETRIVIVEYSGEVIGLLVDQVSEVVYLRRSEIEGSPRISNDDAARYISGVCNKDDRLYILLSIEKLLGKSDASAEMDLF